MPHTDEKMTFYHVATNPNDFKSFFCEGAKSITPQSNKGFYVWTDEELAENHIRFLEGGFLDKGLSNHEALILGIDIPKGSLKLPDWQMDVECAPGLFELLNQYTDVINQKLKKLNIDLPDSNSFLKKISEISCQKESSKITFHFKGKSAFNTDLPYSLTCYENQNPCRQASDAPYLQVLVDSLIQTEPNFKKDYHQLMQIMAQNQAAFKYTGKEPLAISSATHVFVDENGQLKKNVLWDKTKGNQQICPFLKLKNIQR